MMGKVSDPLCDEIDHCKHEGECVLGFNTFACKCSPGWGGKFCEEAHFCRFVVL